jgi:hypothetical protein
MYRPAIETFRHPDNNQTFTCMHGPDILLVEGTDIHNMYLKRQLDDWGSDEPTEWTV